MAADGGHPIVLFDGVCNLCTGSVQFLIRHDDSGTLRFATLQSAVATELLAECDVDPENRQTIVLVEDGTCYVKSEAVLRIGSHLDGPISHVGALRVIPRPLRDLVYTAIAKTRYDVFGRREECMIPSPDVTERFLSSANRTSGQNES